CCFVYCYALHRYTHSFPTRRSSDLGAKRIIFPCVGLAKSPFSFKRTQIFQAVSLSSVSLITIAFSNPFPLTSVTIVLFLIYSFIDRKSTRLNSSHVKISYAVFCLKK